MADIARAALRLGHLPVAGGKENLSDRLADGPVIADVWIDGVLGFVLLLHRRNDGLVAEELYYSIRREDGTWMDPDHLSGGILGIEVEDSSAVDDALAGAPMSVVTESESRVYTIHDPSDDDDELVRVCGLLVGTEVDLLHIETLSPLSPERSTVRRRDVAFALMLLVLLPGEHLRVSALRREGVSSTVVGDALELHHPGQ